MKSAAARIIVPFAPPVIGSEEMAEVLDVLESGWLSTGPRVREFERMFAEYVGSRHAVAVNSCTAALHLSLLAAAVGPGDEVITTPLTFCATANVIVHTGASPVFVDVDPVTRNLTPASAVAGISSRTRALLPVDYAGRPIDAVGFRSLADREGIAFIEDAAHAAEAVASERKVGAIADATCFSFYATKNLTTGEGGMVTTNNDAWAEQIRIASLHGLSRDAWARYAGQAPMRYEVVMAGFKYNMTDLQAALGIHQLAALEERLVRRAAISRRYDEGLAGLPLELSAPVRSTDRHARHLYTVLVDEDECGYTRDALQMALYERGIATSVHFDAVHLQPYYRDRFGFERGMCPVAERIADTTLSLPLSAGMSDESVDLVIAVLNGLLR